MTESCRTMRRLAHVQVTLLAAGLGCAATTQPVAAQEALDPMAANLAPAMAFIQRSFVALADAMPPAPTS